VINSFSSIGVIGGGAWGTALAQIYAQAGRNTLIWAREIEVVESINSAHENKPFLSGHLLSKSLKATDNLKKIAQQDILLLVSPAQFLRASLESLQDFIRPDQPIVICAKGIEISSGELLSDIAEKMLPRALIAVLTGPTFAAEIVRGLPAAVTIAARSKEQGKILQDALGLPSFRPYATTDMAGTQLGGALKNVIAIACGIAQGRGLGDSARAALMTRGLAEIARLAECMGGRRETLLGLCGIGDLTLTCSSMQSRNFSLGAALGAGQTLDDILGARKAVTEGVYTARAAAALAEKYKVDMPICQAIAAIVDEKISIDQAMDNIMHRPFNAEIGDE
jgi:glycerol-3-phosphate dehydrogenase (NAD(P)+)